MGTIEQSLAALEEAMAGAATHLSELWRAHRALAKLHGVLMLHAKIPEAEMAKLLAAIHKEEADYNEEDRRRMGDPN